MPDYLRFVTGVVDSEDLPLSVSRESMKDQRLLRNLNAVLTKRILRWLSGTFVLVKQVLLYYQSNESAKPLPQHIQMDR